MQKISAIKLIGRSNLENGTAFNKQKNTEEMLVES